MSLSFSMVTLYCLHSCCLEFLDLIWPRTQMAFQKYSKRIDPLEYGDPFLPHFNSLESSSLSGVVGYRFTFESMGCHRCSFRKWNPLRSKVSKVFQELEASPEASS